MFLYVNGELSGTESLKQLLTYFSQSDDIRIHISSLREFQISDELILESIIQKFQIPAHEAEEFMKEQ